MASLTKQERADLKEMFGGNCAYCGIELGDKWHADHVEPVNRKGYRYKGKWVLTGDLRSPENDRKDNFFPACVKCNILKSDANIEGFRRNLSYFASSIPTIRTYSHVHHLMRFGKLSIDNTPVKFWFETYLADKGMEV
jgi:hypothetical protein